MDEHLDITATINGETVTRRVEARSTWSISCASSSA